MKRFHSLRRGMSEFSRLPFHSSIWMALLCCSISAAILNAAEAISLKDISRLRPVTSVAIAPDGKRVAYVLSVPREPWIEDDGLPYDEIHVVDESGKSIPFITGKQNLSDVQWTPDSRHISFLAKRDKDKEKALYRISIEGGEAEKVFEHDAAMTGYAWSPNGRRVAFLASEAESAETKERRKKGFTQEIYEEEMRPVRVWILVPGTQDAKPRRLDLPGSASDLRWSPAGPLLGVVLAPTPSVDDAFMKRAVHLVDVESGNVSARLDHPAKLGEFAWSPDGSHLITISGEDINDPQSGRLLLWSAKGEKLRDLLPDYPGHVLTAAWRDPRTICYIGEKGVGTVFEEVNKDTAGMRELLSGVPILTRLSVSQDGAKFAFAGHSATHAAELFRADAADKAARRISDSNPWLADRRFAPQEPVRHKARDGLELEGVLIRPLDEEKGRRYPLVLAVHGGPEAHVPNGWITSYSTPAQVLAARGFAVFFPNYRGSTGRGVAFSKLGQGDPAGKEFDDLVDAVDHLVETGLVDKAKVGITGGSYGGYASAWGATRFSDRFAASVMFVGISDWISGYGSTDIPNEMYHVHFRKWLWEDTDLLFERSPLRHVEKARTPILILHGKDDPRVHPVQSLELYRSLKLLGKAPVRLVLYPGEGHGNRRAASRFDYSVRLLDWMEHYLKGPGGSPPAHKVDYEKRLGIEGAKSAAPSAKDNQD